MVHKWAKEIIQKEITLDDAVLDAFETFNNGCNFKLVIDNSEATKKIYLSYGCYGVHTNLAQGNERRVMNWLESHMDENTGLAELPIHPETLHKLLIRKPCKECGGFIHKVKTPQMEIPTLNPNVDPNKIYDTI